MKFPEVEATIDNIRALLRVYKKVWVESDGQRLIVCGEELNEQAMVGERNYHGRFREGTEHSF